MEKSLSVILIACMLLFSACGNHAVNKEHTSTPMYTLTVNINPVGAGSVSPSGDQYESGSQVTMTATPTSSYDFDYWDGDVSGYLSTVIVTMNSDKSITAHFRVKTSLTTMTTPTPANTPAPSAVEIPPNLIVSPPEVRGLTVTINGVVTPGTTGSTITRVCWDWGDGNSEDHPFPASHAYAAYGDYKITVTAYQTDGLTGTKIFDTGTIDVESYQDKERLVALLVDPLLVADIRLSLNQFEVDLSNDDYIVIERVHKFDTPSEVRTYLSELYSKNGQRLVGALLIGDFPYAYQWVANPMDKYCETISFQYYSDLDGRFDASASYESPGGHRNSYDTHSGNVEWEIWIGLLPYYKGSVDSTITALNRYFIKNHLYRTSMCDLPRAFLQIAEDTTADTLDSHETILSVMKSSVYGWAPFSNSPTARLYFNSIVEGFSVTEGYNDLRTGVADFCVLQGHGYWGAHGSLSIGLIEYYPIRTIFLWSSGCDVGDLDHADNFLTSVIYSPTSDVLFAKGQTSASGAIGRNANNEDVGNSVASALLQGDSIGQAIIAHINEPMHEFYRDKREFWFAGLVLLGDPTLKLRAEY